MRVTANASAATPTPSNSPGQDLGIIKTWESKDMDKQMNSGMCKMRHFSATINTVNVNAELSVQGRALAWLKNTLASLQGQLNLGV
jgi:hypothetical protein